MHVRQIVVHRQQYHEGEEHADGAQEVPDVMVIVESEEGAVLVIQSGLCWGRLKHHSNEFN